MGNPRNADRVAKTLKEFGFGGGVTPEQFMEVGKMFRMERLVPGAFEALNGRGGLRAEIIDGGVIQIGDTLLLGRTPAN